VSVSAESALLSDWRGLVPQSVIVVAQSRPSGLAELLPEEQSVYPHAVPSRQVEFAWGRQCARLALAQWGEPPVAIGVGPSREPLWPPGFTGSITHCQGHCAAAVARIEQRGAPLVTSVGIDVEPARPLPPGLEHRVWTDSERSWVNQQAPGEMPWGRIFFSAKESVFKCLFPLSRRFLGFRDIVIAMAQDGQFRVTVADQPAGADHVRGRIAVSNGFILTAAVWLDEGDY
jgi:4'-phosphopantetheinyl transferase EntD